jgi:peptide/nickel transport system substrate-binding protein
MSKKTFGNGKHPYIRALKEQFLKGDVDRREFLRTATLLGLSAGAAYGFAGVLENDGELTKSALAETPKKGGHLRVAMQVQEWADPPKYDWSPKSNLARQVTEYLTIMGSDGVTRPYLLESWAPSSDLKTWVLKVRKGVTWSNGDKFTADDVVYNMKRWTDSKVGSSLQSLLDAMITSTPTGKKNKKGKEIIAKKLTEGAIEKVDDYTVKLNLNRPELAIPETFFHYPAALVHQSFEKTGSDLSKNPLGTGPYKLVEFRVGEKAVFVRRDGYWGDAPNLDKITYIDPGDDSSAPISMLASGQVDLLHELDVQQIPVIKALPNVSLFKVVTAQTGVMHMQADKEPFTDKRVRQAVRLCLDHHKLLEVAHAGQGAPAEDHHVAPVHPDYFKMEIPKQDHARARQLLKEAGKENLEFTIDCLKSPPWELAAVQQIAEMCKPAGIKANINVMPSSAYWKIWTKTPCGFTRWTHRPLGVMVLNLAYRSNVAWNESHHANPEFDKLLDQAGGIADPVARSKVVGKLQKIMQDDAPIAQPLWRAVFTAGSSKIRGFSMHPVSFHLYNDIWLA